MIGGVLCCISLLVRPKLDVIAIVAYAVSIVSPAMQHLTRLPDIGSEGPRRWNHSCARHDEVPHPTATRQGSNDQS